MPNPPDAAPMSDTDYEAIEAAVVETHRGRWFLAEYARRNRQADTTMLLSAIERLEAAVRGEPASQSVDRIRFDLVEMAKAISRTKAEIASIKPDSEHPGKFGDATEELDSIVLATEAATSDILAAAEQIQEIAWTLREQGLEAEVCDLIDAKSTAIYTACSFQDLTGQRTSKVMEVMRYLERRINAMIDIWGLDDAMAAEAAEAVRTREGEAALLNGPALPGHGLDQADVDVVMGPRADAARAAAHAHEAAARPAATAMVHRAGVTNAAPVPSPAAAPELAPPLAPPAPDAKASANDPLAPLNALSAEEKIALFT